MAEVSVTLQHLKDIGADILDLRPGCLLVLSCDAPISPRNADTFRRAVAGLLEKHDINVPVLVLPSAVTAQVLHLAEEGDA